jgi:ABC-type nitrate/sulfonate/bicarbonate transport system substrate-binding protein
VRQVKRSGGQGTPATAGELRVIAFPGAPNLPTFAALERDLFERHGVEVVFDFTSSSIDQAKRVAAGDFDVAFTAFDNVVAYSTGQGAAGAGIDPDYVVIMGATQVELSLVAEPSIRSHEDLRGRSIALDALNTGFAFVLYEMLEREGIDATECEFAGVGATPRRWESVRSGTHAATLTIEPFTSLALAEGFRVIDTSTRLFDAYQGGVVAARRSVLDQDEAKVRALIAGYLDGLDWVLDPSNREEATQLLKRNMDISDRVIDPVMSSVLAPESGLTPGARLLPSGMRTVLDLRTRHGSGVVPADVESFSDLSLWKSVSQASRTR